MRRTTLGVDARFLADLRRRRGRHHAALGQRFRRGHFHFQPALEFAFLAPDAAHLFARIS